jgi:3-oxoadipate enol-lactonase
MTGLAPVGHTGPQEDDGSAAVSELVSTARGSFTVQVTGPADGPPLVLVAGLGDDHTSWEPVLPWLTPRYRCVTFDNRGIGGSPVTPGPYAVADLAADAHAVHQALRLPPCVAVGSSLGGAICQEWALAHPGDLTGTVLSNTWGRSDPFLRVLFEHWIGLAGQPYPEPLLDSLLLFCFSAGYLERRPETVAEFRAFAPPDLTGFAAAAAACREHDALARLGALTQPALVLAGRADILTRPQLATELASALPQARLLELDAGHMTFWEAPQAWGEAVTRWLDSL